MSYSLYGGESEDEIERDGEIRTVVIHEDFSHFLSKKSYPTIKPSGPNLDTHRERPVTQSGEHDTWSGQPLNP